jgi:hypothetical protein
MNLSQPDSGPDFNINSPYCVIIMQQSYSPSLSEFLAHEHQNIADWLVLSFPLH